MREVYILLFDNSYDDIKRFHCLNSNCTTFKDIAESLESFKFRNRNNFQIRFNERTYF